MSRDDVFGEWLAFTLSAELQKVAKWCSELYENVAHEKPQEILRLLCLLLRWWSSQRRQLLVAEKLIYFTLDAISSQLLLVVSFYVFHTQLLCCCCGVYGPLLMVSWCMTMKIFRISSNSPEKSSAVERLFKVLAVSCELCQVGNRTWNKVESLLGTSRCQLHVCCAVLKVSLRERPWKLLLLFFYLLWIFEI